MTTVHFLRLTWTISRARDTHGYKICTLRDDEKKFSTCGGGYDMVGTVFGDWLWDAYKEKLKKLKPYDEQNKENYGLFVRNHRWVVDGRCGFRAMEDLAKKIGLRIKNVIEGRKQRTIGYIVTDENTH